MKDECRRTVYDGKGGIEIIYVKQHSYAWSGKIPCTGVYRCVYCGALKEDSDENILVR